MKKFIGAIVCFFWLFPLLNGMVLGEWNWKSPLPQGNLLLKVQFIDSLRGWAVGNYGTLLHTTTGGSTWYEQEFGRTDNLLDISMISSTEGWSVGDNGTILHTIDGGDNWDEQTSGTFVGLNAVHFVDSMNGWAVGDNETILRTSNGGTTWVTQHSVPGPVSLNSVYFLSASNGWCAGSNNKLFHTTDGGVSWSQRTIGTGIISFTSITFVTSSLGLIAGEHGAVFRTTDGGLFWPPISIGDTVNLNEIRMLNSSTGWIVGEDGKLCHTLDGGNSWSVAVRGDGSSLNGVSLLGSTVCIVGEFGYIWKSTDNGGNWTPLDQGSRLSVNWTAFPSPSTGYAVGQAGLLMRTTNAGESWLEASSPSPSVSCYGVACTDANHAWAVGDDGTLLRTTDGTLWSTQSSGVGHSLFGITFANSSAGWIVGGEFTNFTGVILHTSDGGTSWGVEFNAVPQILFGVSFPDGSSGWAVGENGYIIHSTNGGTTWTQQTSGTFAPLFWCAFIDANTGWAVGDGGLILHTTNGGSTWTQQGSGVTSALYSIAVVSQVEVFVSGDFGTVLHTTDGGSSWQIQYSRTLNAIFGIAPSTGSYVVACGDYGSILKNTISPPGSKTISTDIAAGWNIVSVPLDVPDKSKVVLYPTTQETAFSYDGLSYLPSDTLIQGYGYWLRFPSTQTVSITGMTIPADTITLFEGWNIIGILSDSVPVSSVTTDPPGIITSSFFGYSGSYSGEQILAPGYGYWIKTTQAGKLILHSSGTATPFQTVKTFEVPLQSLNALDIRDGRGNGTTLYFGRNVDERWMSNHALPPLPPPDCFDARFGNGNAIASFAIESVRVQSSIIRIQAQAPPLTLRWHFSASERGRYELLNGETKELLMDSFSGTGEATIKDVELSSLLLSLTPSTGPSIPKEFSLQHNYPNPFNPSTSIPFTLPVKSHVRLEILNVLGQQVALLLGQDMDEGFHTVSWAATTASGMYFYRLQATPIEGNEKPFTAVRKLILLR